MSNKSKKNTGEKKEFEFKATLETCRLCLKNGAKIKIFDSKKYTQIPEKITNCFRLKISKNDGLPEKVCKGCVNQICKSDKFKAQCENADKILRKTLNRLVDDLIQPKEELLDECYTVDSGLICKQETDVKIEIEDNDFSDQESATDNFESFDSFDNKIESNDGSAIMIFKNNEICNESSKIKQFSDSRCFRDNNSAVIDKSVPKNKRKIDGIHIKPKIKKSNTAKNNSDGNVKRKRDKSSASNLCPICGKIFTKAGLLSNHLKRHGTEKNFVCSECSKAFVTKNQLQKHISCHLPNRDYTCETCGKTFKTSSHAKMHIETVHKKLKAVTCQLCQKEFMCMRNLKMHMKIHTGEKEHQCEFCARKFTFKISLTLHRRIHTGEKPYACRFCDSKFAVSKTLKEHERLHTGETPYLCPVCNRGFMQKSNMKSHFRNNHKNFTL